MNDNFDKMTAPFLLCDLERAMRPTVSRFGFVTTLAVLVAVGGVGFSLLKTSPIEAPTVAAEERFDFDVVRSFDAKYQGDTPGHIGRHGGLGERRPLIALGDPVYRGDEQVGIVTELVWTRAQGALDIEFDPLPKARVCVGDLVWVKLGKPAAE
jgi:hypothetical protein